MTTLTALATSAPTIPTMVPSPRDVLAAAAQAIATPNTAAAGQRSSVVSLVRNRPVTRRPALRLGWTGLANAPRSRG